MLVQAKGLARKALDAVARHGGAERARSDSQTQAGTFFMIGQDRQTKVRVGQLFAALPDLAKLDRQVQALTRLERQPVLQVGDRYTVLRSASGTEALAALRATASQQPAAALGGPARAETRGSGAVQITGIECTFHSATSGKNHGANQRTGLIRERRQGY